MTGRPPISTLFPYPPLFRPTRRRVVDRGDVDRERRGGHGQVDAAVSGAAVGRDHECKAGTTVARTAGSGCEKKLAGADVGERNLAASRDVGRVVLERAARPQ